MVASARTSTPSSRIQRRRTRRPRRPAGTVRAVPWRRPAPRRGPRQGGRRRRIPRLRGPRGDGRPLGRLLPEREQLPALAAEAGPRGVPAARHGPDLRRQRSVGARPSAVDRRQRGVAAAELPQALPRALESAAAAVRAGPPAQAARAGRRGDPASAEADRRRGGAGPRGRGARPARTGRSPPQEPGRAGEGARAQTAGPGARQAVAAEDVASRCRDLGHQPRTQDHAARTGPPARGQAEGRGAAARQLPHARAARTGPLRAAWHGALHGSPTTTKDEEGHEHGGSRCAPATAPASG